MNYAAAAARARSLILRKGLLLAVTRRVSVVNAVSGAVSSATLVTYSLPAVVLPVGDNPVTRPDSVNTAAGPRPTQERQFIAAADGVGQVPRDGDTLVYDGGTWEISGLTKLLPQSVTLIYQGRLCLVGPASAPPTYVVRWGMSASSTLTEEEIDALPHSAALETIAGSYGFPEEVPGGFAFIAFAKAAPLPVEGSGFWLGEFPVDMADTEDGYPDGVTGWGTLETAAYRYQRSKERLVGGFTIQVETL